MSSQSIHPSELTALYGPPPLHPLYHHVYVCVCPSHTHIHTYIHGIRTAGTHDLQLAMSTIHALLNMRRSSSLHPSSGSGSDVKAGVVRVRVPQYDKSLRDGRGDRVAEQHWQPVSEPVDVVLLEGEGCLWVYMY